MGRGQHREYFGCHILRTPPVVGVCSEWREKGGFEELLLSDYTFPGAQKIDETNLSYFEIIFGYLDYLVLKATVYCS